MPTLTCDVRPGNVRWAAWERLGLDTHFGGSSTWRESSKAVRGEEASQGVGEKKGG